MRPDLTPDVIEQLKKLTPDQLAVYEKVELIAAAILDAKADAKKAGFEWDVGDRLLQAWAEVDMALTVIREGV